MMKANIKMYWIKTRENVLVILYTVCDALLFHTISFFKKCNNYTWRIVTFNSFTKNNSPP